MAGELVERLRAHVAELEERLERESGDLRYAKQALDHETARALKFGKRITALTAEVALLTEALKFYRDEFHPKIGKPVPGASSITFHPSEALLEDCGNRAMAALSEGML